MSPATPRPVLTIYRSAGCHLCDDAEALLRDELAERTRSGLPIPTVERIDISADAELDARFRRRIPVFALGDDQVELVTSQRQVRELLDRALRVPAR
jgi:hypothetical protein